MKIFSLPIINVLLTAMASASFADGYDRKDFNYRSYKPNTSIGFYTGQTCSAIDIDHVVSLKDAYDTGGASWSLPKKQSFANDKANHVPSCASVNRSKGASNCLSLRDFSTEPVSCCCLKALYADVSRQHQLD